MVALAELDTALTNNLTETEKKVNMKNVVDEIISKYF